MCKRISMGEGNVAIYAMPNCFLLNKICLNQTNVQNLGWLVVSWRGTVCHLSCEEIVEGAEAVEIAIMLWGMHYVTTEMSAMNLRKKWA